MITAMIGMLERRRSSFPDMKMTSIDIDRLRPAPTLYPDAKLPVEYDMATVADSTALPEETKLTMTMYAKMGTWYDGWLPYCGTCSTFNRMERHPYGFRCSGCGNMIGFDLMRLKESPLNKQ